MQIPESERPVPWDPNANPEPEIRTSAATARRRDSDSELARTLAAKLDTIESLYQWLVNRNMTGIHARQPNYSGLDGGGETIQEKVRAIETELDIVTKRAGIGVFSEPEELRVTRSALNNYYQTGLSMHMFGLTEGSSYWRGETENDHALALEDRRALDQ